MSATEMVGTIIANALVGSGLIIEYVVILRAIVASGDAERLSNEKIAASEARAAEANELTAKAVLETARQGRLNLIAINAGLVTSEVLAFAGKLSNREQLSDSARVCLLVSKFEPFAGTQFDAFITSDDINVETFLNSLRNALIKAGWIEVIAHERSRGDHASIHGVRLDVDGSKGRALLEAASALASALNAEGITAVVNPKPESDAAKANVVHILVGAKAG